MKHFTLFLRKGFTSALALALAMIVLGGGSALADTVIFDGTVVTGWEYRNSLGTSVLPTNSTLYDGGGYGTPKTYTSVNNTTISAGQTIEISAKRSSSSSTSLPSIKVKYSSDNGTSWLEAVEITETTISSNSVYSTAIVDNVNIIGSYKIQFEIKNVYIERITLKDAPTSPILSVSPSSVAFGSITGNNSHTITVSNTGVGTMDVTIANDNTTDFTVSATSLTGIGAGESQTFNVTFNFDDENLGDKSANITVTPSYATEAAVVIPVTATSVEVVPDYIFDENEASTWSTSFSGTKKVLLKYTPVDGWNTFCVPFSPYGHMDDIFGAGWKAYTFDSYSEGTISFKKASTLTYATPYIVYVENAVSHPSGVLLETTSVYGTTPGKPVSNGVTFQGTYAPKAAGTLTGNYGVTSAGTIAKAGEGASIKGYRAYFTGVPAGFVKGFVIDGEDATDIGLVQMVEGSDKPVYNMSGQKVQKAQRGIYIINGKKVVIK